MARIFIPTYTDRRTGKRRKSSIFHIEFKDHNLLTRRVMAFPVTAGKSRSEALGTKLERLVACRAVKEPLTPDLQQWVEDMSQALRDKLVEWAIIDGNPKRLKPISVHLIGYCHELKAKGDDRRHIRQTIAKLGRLVKEQGIRIIADIDVEKVTDFLTALRLGKGAVGPRTSNYYLVAIRGFVNWLVRVGRMNASPLAGIEPNRTEDEETRWPLSIEDMRTLLDVTASAATRFGMTGAERAILYRVAVETGYRAGELRSLTVASFDLNPTTPTVRLLAKDTKAKRGATLPLRPEMATLLRCYFANKLPTALAFPNMPDSRRTADMIREDLREARIAITNDLGASRDFHCLRHCCGTWLAAVGTNPKVIQTIMRHSTMRLTMDRYVHADREQTASALKKFPDLSSPMRQVDTGTDGRAAEGACALLAPEGARGKPNVAELGQRAEASDESATGRKPTEIQQNQSSGSGRIRTYVGARPADLQSAPIVHSGTLPHDNAIVVQYDIKAPSSRPLANSSLEAFFSCFPQDRPASPAPMFSRSAACVSASTPRKTRIIPVNCPVCNHRKDVS